MKTTRGVEIRHVLPQRVRLQAPQLSGHSAACERIARAMAELGPFDKVSVRPLTGSVIFESEMGEIDAAELANELAQLIQAEKDEQGAPLREPKPVDGTGPTRIARAVVHAVAAINGDMRARLEQRADLATFLPVFFAACGLSEVSSYKQLPVPSWFNLFWWSLRSFMTFNFQAVDEEVQHEGGHAVPRSTPPM